MNVYVPRSHQQQCLDALALARTQGTKKALVVMASGLGKTLTGALDALNYLSANPHGRVLVLCHSEAILSQIKGVFMDVFGDNYSYGMYNGKEKAATATDFLFANLQSVNLHKSEFGSEEFSFIIVDEAHHSPAKTYREAIGHFCPQFLLGMTATPERMDDADLSEIFGEIVFEYRLVDAVRDGWLSDIEYRVKTDELQEQKLGAILDSGEKFSLAQLNREVFAPKRDEEIARIIHQDIADKDNPTMVIFCQTIAHAENFAAIMGDAVVIHSRMDFTERSQRLQGFRAGAIKAICAVDILNEGIDVPRTDVIVFLRVTQSKIVFTQQLGRGLRCVEGKDKVLVLDFVSTADRLQMLFALEREFKVVVGRYPRKKLIEEHEYFTLKIDAPIFRERKVDIIRLIEQAQYDLWRQHNHQSFSKWEDLPKEKIWDDVIRRLTEFREATGRMVSKYDLGTGEIPSMYFLKFYLGEEVTLTEVREKAYPDARRIWTKEKVDAALIEIADFYGKVPRQTELREYAKLHKNAVPSMEVVTRYYDDFSDAYLQLGYDVDKAYLPWSTEEVEVTMRQAYDYFGHVPSLSEYNRYRREHVSERLPCTEAICNVDGQRCGWQEAFLIKIDAKDDELTPERAAELLRYVADYSGKKSLSIKYFQEYRTAHPEEGIPGCGTIQKALKAKTWNEAKTKAGLTTTPWYH